MDVPGDDGIVGVAGVVVLGVDLDAVAVGVAQIEVEGVRDPVASGTALDGIRATERAELVADRQDVVLLVRREAHVVHARAVAAGHRGVVDGGLAPHPRCVDRAGFVLDVLGDAEPEILHVSDSPGHIRCDLVEVVQSDEFTGDVHVIAPRHPLHVLRLVEELVGEAERVDHADRIADALHEAVRAATHIAAELGEELDGAIEVLGGAHPV